MDRDVAPHLTDADRGEIDVALASLAWKFALPASGREPGSSINEAGPGDEDIAKAFLARAAVMAVLREKANVSIDGDVVTAMEHGATTEEIAAALGITRQAVDKRWGYIRRISGRVAVVISRRDRIHHDEDDARGRYGEVGGAEQYDSDRSAWPIGKTIRELARYAIIAVDGTVQRIYPIDPDGWHQTTNGKWEFTAIGDRECTAEEIEAAHAAGELPLRPGDSCPTRQGGAYRPHWFS